MGGAILSRFRSAQYSVITAYRFVLETNHYVFTKTEKTGVAQSFRITVFLTPRLSVTNILLVVTYKISRPRLIYFCCYKNIIPPFDFSKQVKQFTCLGS